MPKMNIGWSDSTPTLARCAKKSGVNTSRTAAPSDAILSTGGVLHSGLASITGADTLRHAVKWKGQDVSLTVTEFLLLQALAQRPGFVKSRDQLMDVAYDDQVYVDDRTIDSHIKRLRKKMRQADDEFSAIETLYGIGYRYNEE